MKFRNRIIYSVLLLGATFLGNKECFAQSSFTQKCLGGYSRDRGGGICQTSDGGFIVCGFIESNDGDVTCSVLNITGWLVKLDSVLNIQWQKCIAGSGLDYLSCIDTTKDKGFIIGAKTNGGGSTQCSGHGLSDYWIIKTDSLGDITWKNCFGGSGFEYLNDIHQTSDGGYIVAGESNSLDGDVSGGIGNGDFWILKLDSSGSMVWNKVFGGFGSEACTSIQETNGHNFVACGRATHDNGDVGGTHGGYDCWVIMLDSLGNLMWQKALGGSSDDAASDLLIDSNGDIIIIGEESSSDGDVNFNHGSWDTWVVKLNPTGNVLWEKSYGGTGYDSGRSLASTYDGGYMLLSSGSSIDGDAYCSFGSQFWFAKIDSTGIFEYQQCIGGSSFDIPTQIISTADSGFAAIGFTYSDDGDVSSNHSPCVDPSCTDIWVVKLNKDFVSGIEVLASKISLESYPNPFSNFIYIKSESNMSIELNLHNTLGELLFSNTIQTNQAINFSFLRDGIYFLDSPQLQIKSRLKIVKIGSMN